MEVKSSEHGRDGCRDLVWTLPLMATRGRSGTVWHVPVILDYSHWAFDAFLPLTTRVAARRDPPILFHHSLYRATRHPMSDSDLPDDARLLFSPIRRKGRDPSTDAPAPADTSMSADDSYSPARPADTVGTVYVQVPHLPPAQKSKYRSIAEDLLAPGEEYPHENVERVVGQVEERHGTFLYVLYTDGIIHKVSRGTIELLKLAMHANFGDLESSVHHLNTYDAVYESWCSECRSGLSGINQITNYSLRFLLVHLGTLMGNWYRNTVSLWADGLLVVMTLSPIT